MTTIIPLKGGEEASNQHETRAEQAVEDTILTRAELLFGASLIATGKIFVRKVGDDDAAKAKTDRKVYIYLPRLKGEMAKIRLNGDEWPLSEGDGAFVCDVDLGDENIFESMAARRLRLQSSMRIQD